MDHTEIQEHLTELHNLNANKGFPPLSSCQLTIYESRFNCHIAESFGVHNWPDEVYRVFFGGTPEECLDAAYQFIADLPDHDTAAKRAAVAQYGKAVDALHDAGFDDVVMIPVRETMAALTSNLLTYEGDGK